MKTKIGILTILLLGLCFAGCNKDSTLPEQTEQQKVYLYVNTFAFNRINQYYLWNEEVAAALKDWKTADEPIAKVQSVRYRDDRWTLLTDDVDSFYDSTTGHRKGFGFEAGMDLSAAQLIVLYTYAGSPAEEAGLKRGDAITSLNGSPIPTQDYSAFIKQALRNKDRVTLGMKSGATISLTARDMYENPVLLSKIFDCGGKKVGYLAYTSFTLDSYKDLISICKAFKQAGVSELIPPYAMGSARSAIMAKFGGGHHGAKPSDAERRVFACWIDLGVPFGGSYCEATDWTDDERRIYDYHQRKRAAFAESERLAARAAEGIEAGHLNVKSTIR